MEVLMLILCALPLLVTTISVSSNGNSPDTKMVGGMVIDVQKGFIPMESKISETRSPAPKSNYEKSKRIFNSTKLSINERYRRLIPYMTFYYANDLTTSIPHAKNVEVEKAEIVEARGVDSSQERQPKRIVYSSNRNIPRYEGNRLTQYNIASANPTKIFYKDIVPTYQSANKQTPNYNPLLLDYKVISSNDYEVERPGQKLVSKPSNSHTVQTRKPYLNLYAEDNAPNIRYYLTEKDQNVKYKLVPYEQTPPIKIVTQTDTYYQPKKPIPVPVLVEKEQIYIKPRPVHPQYFYNIDIQSPAVRKQPVNAPESYYEKQRPQPLLVEPVVESGFKPITDPGIFATEAPVYTPAIQDAVRQYESQKQPIVHVATESVGPQTDYRPNYYQYPEREFIYKPEQYDAPSNAMTLSALVTVLQRNKSLPKPITKENVGSSIKTLLQILNALKIVPHQNDLDVAILTTAKPLLALDIEEVTEKLKPQVIATPIPSEKDFHEEQYLAPIHTPSQHLDEGPTGGSTSQQFPLPTISDEEGGTPGRPGVDYPILSTIPQTKFNCKTQRYKGFFADPETRCQVWHYCDLNGGQASFLCPNGTIFSQAGLTCDWWFNVRCASTTQLYVLNESLYKFILPHSPKFPEDYSGPLVDKYLTLKFKEMEEEFKKNKNKNGEKDSSESDNSEEKEESSESTKERDTEKPSEPSQRGVNGSLSTISEASVIVESPGASGNVERLQE
ncbi:hypothetical protein K1T71_006642 [Dendrolimus kikuchii]|uniref:Uncharacterized protein n=1 Tax=Dendrolimus kikuchii TaxID=765133 RepID=A0ACC1D1E5_9NEOP|nr:hypothetical protein K1T71_006642 [Dendrolimus kikuchii]